MSTKKAKSTRQVTIKNRKAHFEYTFLEQYVAGMVLTGTEIKSIRQGRVSLAEAYCYFSRGELWIKGMHIATYAHGNIHNHVEDRTRKLLLSRKELNKLQRTKEKGLTIIPIKLFMNDRGLAKLEIALAKGKKLYDKRQTIKERDLARAQRKESS